MRAKAILLTLYLIFCPLLAGAQRSLPRLEFRGHRLGEAIDTSSTAVCDTLARGLVRCTAGLEKIGAASVGIDYEYLDGRLNRITLDFEPVFFEELRDLLTVRYGKPGQTKRAAFATVGGSHDMNETVTWSFSDAILQLNRYGASLLKGSGNASSSKGLELQLARYRERQRADAAHDLGPQAKVVVRRDSNSADVIGGTGPVNTDQPYFEFQVEKRVQQIPGTGNLRYPDMLRSANVEGEVLAQFVVDADGRYEAGTFKVLKSTHELFTKAVKNALPDMRFYPAEVGGKKVPQLVQQTFPFPLPHE